MELMKKTVWGLESVLKKVSPSLFVKMKYYRTFGEKLNLKSPEGFNEKILWLALYWQNPLVYQCADKYGVREYAKDKGLEFLLPKLYGCYDSVDKIDWDNLPEKFALKCTHGCKWNIICDDKEHFDVEDAKEKLSKWMNSTYSTLNYEPQYEHMIHRIIMEEYIETDAGMLPIDYKIYCFNGEPKFLLACVNRETDLQLEWYNFDWTVFDIGAKPNLQKAPKPKCLDQMIEYAKKLSEGFPFVRVDFYDKDGVPILGEMTFTPYFGMAKYYSKEGNLLIGSMLQLPPKWKG